MIDECFVNGEIVEGEGIGKHFIRKQICEGLNTKIASDGKYYCVLHFPETNKFEDFNNAFSKLVEKQISKNKYNQSRNQYHYFFNGIWFPSNFILDKLNLQQLYLENSTQITVFLNFDRCVFNDIFNISGGTTFHNSFDHTIFRGNAYFHGKYTKNLILNSTKFLGNTVSFLNAELVGFSFIGAYVSANTKVNFGFTKFPQTRIAYFGDSTLNGEITFTLANFNEVDWKGAKFDGHVKFNRATFNNSVIFNNVRMNIVDFSEANFNESFFLRGTLSDGKSAFNENSEVKFSFARFEQNHLVKFQSAKLKPEWFANVNVKEFTFIGVKWDDNMRSCLAKLRVTDPFNTYEILNEIQRNLAENADLNHRYEQASRFRQMAFETEWLEKKEIFSNRLKNLVTESEKLKRRFGGSIDEKDKANLPINSLGILLNLSPE